jgi:TonB family protein
MVAMSLMGAMVTDNSAHAQSIAGGKPPNSQTSTESRFNITDTVTERPAPEYPALAKAARISGRVDVEVVVDNHGKVKSARATSGHPLLKDAAVACARNWKFPGRSEISADIIGIVTIVFDLSADQRRRSVVDYPANEREANIRIVRQCIEGAPTDAKTLALALAKLAVSALDEKRVDEAIDLFEKCEKSNKLPKSAQPYYGSLLYNKHIYIRDRLSATNGGPNAGIDAYLSQALQLFLQAYSDELEAKPIDSRKLLDIARLIDAVYAAMGKSEDRFEWMRVALNYSGLPDDVRAIFSYELAVRLWQKSYDLTSAYHSHNRPIPTEYFSQIRELLNEAFPLIHSAQDLAPTFANPWFYEKLLAIEEMKIETDLSRIDWLKRRAMEVQDRYMEVQRASRGVDNNRSGPYASGLPSLNSQPTLPAPPPPPPPPPRL